MPTTFKAQLCPSDAEGSLFHFMEACIFRLQQFRNVGTAHNYRASLNSFRRFRNGMDIPIACIDHRLVEDYRAWLRCSGLAPNSTAFYLRLLRAVYNRAVGQGLTPDRRPFRTVSTSMERTRKRAIPFREVKRIRELDLAPYSPLAFARDIFLFQFLCRGMSFVDAAYLRKSDLRGGFLIYRRRKTNQPLTVKVVRKIQVIIDRYSVRESPYLLPIITRPGDNERRQYANALRRVNNALKVIGSRLELSVPLTTYVSRHAWASIAKSRNISVNVISDALGHDSIHTTQIYLASIDASAIDRANEIVIRDL